MNPFKMLHKVKNYHYLAEKLVCYYFTFYHDTPPINMFTKKQNKKKLLEWIDEASREMKQLYTEGIFNFFYEYNACRRFLKLYKKLVKHWYWTFRWV